MLRLLTPYILLIALSLVVGSPGRVKSNELYSSSDLTETYIVSERTVGSTPTQLKEITTQPDFLGLFYLPLRPIQLSFSKQSVFNNYHDLQSFYGSFYPSGPSPPQAI